MKITKVDLYEYFNLPRVEGSVGYLTCYVNDGYSEFCPNRLRPAMIVVPGGGYGMRSQREEEPVAFQYLANDYTVFTLQYAINPAKHPTMVIEGCMAIAYVRENAKALHVNENAIACVGFSAGGHVIAAAASLATRRVGMQL